MSERTLRLTNDNLAHGLQRAALTLIHDFGQNRFSLRDSGIAVFGHRFRGSVVFASGVDAVHVFGEFLEYNMEVTARG